MRTISKNKYSAELTNILREFSKSKYEIYTDSGDYTELDAIRAGINSLDYLDWDNLAEDDFLGDVHALWIGEAVIEPEDERNYYKMAKTKSTEGNDLYLGLRNDELFLTPKFDFAHKFTEDDLHTALIKAKLCSTSITKVKTGNEADGQDSNPSDILTESNGITKVEKGNVATDWIPNPSDILTKSDSITKTR